MQRTKLLSRLSPRAKDILWHSIKALLCLVQLYALTAPAFSTITSVSKYLMDDVNSIPYLCLLLVVQVALSVAIWIYYDRGDDRSFDRFCAAEETPRLLSEPAYLTALILSIAGCTALFFIPLYPIARMLLPSLPVPLSVALAVLVGGAVAALCAILRLRRLEYVWSVQKTLRRSTDKRHSLFVTILYAAVFFVSLIAAAAGLSVLIPILLSLIVVMVYLLTVPTLILIGLILFLCVWRFLRHIGDRRKFLRRLENLQKAGELTYTIHGHPYRALFFRRVPFALTITDYPHPESRVKTPTTYQVAVANCNRRRMTVVLCEDNVFQFMYGFNLRVLGQASTLGLGSGKVISIPMASFFVSHTFDFPEGEGKRILLVDPAPHQLCMRGFKRDELIALDNASELYGYTVYGKNSFVNMLERS